MIRRLLLWGAAGLLSACGSDTVHAPAPLGMLVKPGSAPWLSVAGGDDKLTVRGIDRTVIVEAQPSLAKALQSQLGQQLQADYVQDLVVTCTDLQDALQVDSDKAPDQLVLHLSLHCQLWARGPQSGHDYKIQVSTRVPAGAAGEAYGQAFPSLVSEASADLSARLRADIRSLSQRVR